MRLKRWQQAESKLRTFEIEQPQDEWIGTPFANQEPTKQLYFGRVYSAELISDSLIRIID